MRKLFALTYAATLIFSTFIATISGTDAYAITLPATINCPDGGTYDIDINGVASNGNTCTGNLTLDSAVTSVGNNGFQNATLTSLTVPSSVTTIGTLAFEMNLLTSLSLSNGLLSIGNNSFASAKITSLILPDSLTNLGNSAFQSDDVLTTLVIPNLITTIPNNVFRYAPLTSLVLPDNLLSIGNFAFQNAQLTSLTIPSLVTHIGDHAFQFDPLISLVLPASVSTIGSGTGNNSAFASAATSLTTFVNDSSASLVESGLEGLTPVPLTAPAFTLSATSGSVIIGSPITSYNIISTGGPVAKYAISPPVTGNGTLSFNTYSGQLSGVPSTAAAPQNYVITAHNAVSPDATASYSLTISDVISTPTVTSVTPVSGSLSGGTLITINGTGFTDPPTVTVDGSNCTQVTFISSTSISCITPAGSTGVAKNIVVTNPDSGSGTGTALYTYTVPISAPTVTSLQPAYGPEAGGTLITITGTGFIDSPTVTLGGGSCTQVTFISSTKIRCFTPSGMAGPAEDIVVTNPDSGSGTGVGLFSFRFTMPPPPPPPPIDPTPTPTPTATPTPTPTATPTATPSPSPSPTSMSTPAPSPTPTATPTPTPSATPSPSPTPSVIIYPPASTAPVGAPQVQVDKAGVQNGGITFYGTSLQPQVVGENGAITPPAPLPNSGAPLPPDAITVTETFIGQPGGTLFNTPDVAVPVTLVEVALPAIAKSIPGLATTVQSINKTFVALENVGNDMSPITRKKAKKVLVATVLASQLTMMRRK